jgi:hypothetical protein
MFHTFTYKENEDMGYSGWVLNAKPYFDPMDGRGVAHDVLEEMPHGGEQPHDELMALGAMLFGRCSMSMPFPRPVSEVLASEFSPLFSHAFNEEGYHLVDAPKVPRLDQGRYGEDYEREEAIIQEVAPKVLEYIEKYGEDEWGDNPDNLEEAKQWVPHAQNWLRIGFRRARRRFYPYMDGCDVAYMFERIEREVNAIKGAELYDRLTLRVKYQRNDLELWHTPRYELPW